MEQISARKFLIATHGHFARGVKSSLDIIIGQTENIFLIEAYVEANKGIESELKTFIENTSVNEELIIFTDLLGGSITNQVLQATKGRNVHVISGFNLGLLIEVIMADIETPAGQVIEEAIANAKEQMVYVNKLMTLNSDDKTN
jgi:fructoselysine and glucoselysine-specific PTS system IIA component